MELGAGNADDDPARGEDWSPDRQVRAAFLLSLLCGAVEVEPGLVGEINLDGARIIGRLGFPGVTFKHRLRLNNCYVSDGIELTEGIAQTLRLEGCRIAAIYLLGAKIDGSLTLSGACVGGKGRRAISADRLTLTGNMFCDEGFQAYGEVSLAGASIGGQLIFRGAHLDGNGESALTADGLRVTDAMFCDQGFQACGGIRLVGARIGGQLHLDDAHLDGNGEPALTADGLTVTDSLFCRAGFQADGEIRLTDASIGGEFNLSTAHLDGKGLPALTADRASPVLS